MAERATVARPYAKAAFACAQEQGRLAEWSGWLATAREVVLSDEFQALERSPGVRHGQLEELIAGICGASLDAPGRALLALLTENGRLDYLPEIAARFAELEAEASNVADVEVVSASSLDDRQRERLAGALRKRLSRDVRLHCSIDPALIGGAVVRSGDLLIDGSLRGRLERLGTELTG
ncbi:MAG: F0F1 ATP synthase subunit delta [Steroidobacteraceae bacterium]|nr:F0F1 ATP synthase subunit delta [Steroidobacteraceae bacterium]